MKKIFLLPLAMSLIIPLTPSKVSAKYTEFVYYDNTIYTTYEQDNRTLISIREFAESLGYKVNWEKKENSVVLEKENEKIKFKVGTKEVNNNGSKIELDYKIVSSYKNKKFSTFVPEDFIEKVFKIKKTVIEEKTIGDIKYPKIIFGDVKKYEESANFQDIGVASYKYKATKENSPKDYDLVKDITEKYIPYDKSLTGTIFKMNENKEEFIGERYFIVNKVDYDRVFIWMTNAEVMDGKLKSYLSHCAYCEDDMFKDEKPINKEEAEKLANQFYKDYVDKNGEVKFDKIEKEDLAVFKNGKDEIVIDLKGGFVCRFNKPQKK